MSRRRRDDEDEDPFGAKRKRIRDDPHDGDSGKKAKKKHVTFRDDDDDDDDDYDDRYYDVLQPTKSNKNTLWDNQGNASDADDDDYEYADLLETKRKRRGQVNTNFSDDEEEAGTNRRPKNKSQDDEDMFAPNPSADMEEEDEDDAYVKKKRIINYMKASEIEGQEWQPDADEYDSDGIKIEPYNMDQELEEGGFDESGHYIRKKDDQAMHDNWLQGINENQILRARAAHERQKARARLESSRDEETPETRDASRIWYQILSYMRPGETVAATMKRYGNGHKPKVAKAGWKAKIKSKSKEGDSTSNSAQPEQHGNDDNKKAVDELTTLSDQLMELGHFDVFDQRYEQIVRQLRIANLIKEDWKNGDPLPAVPKPSSSTSDEHDETYWEYKTSQDTLDVQGPSTSHEMNKMIQRRKAKEEEVGTIWIRKVTRQTSLDPFAGFVLMPEEFAFVNDTI